jgi:hypothetical protein
MFLLLIYLRQSIEDEHQWIGSFQLGVQLGAICGSCMSSKTIVPSSLVEPRDMFELATNALIR